MLDANRQFDPVQNADRDRADISLRQSIVGLQLLLERLARSWRRIGVVAGASLIGGLIYVVMTPAQYSATALILVDSRRLISLRDTPTLADSGIVSANLESQVELLRSERTIRKVVQAEDLLNNPALKPDFVSRAISVLRSALPGQDVEPEDEMKLEAATRALKARTSAKRVGLTFLIEIGVTFPDRVAAAHLANAYARTYITDQVRLREETENRAAEILRQRTEELRTQAQAAEQAVEQFKFAGSQGESSASARVVHKNLESVAQTYRTVHDKFLERYAETLQQVNFSILEAQLVSVAYPPTSKSWPKASVILPATLFIGTLFGILWVMLLESSLI